MSQAPVSVPLLLSYSSLQLLPDRFVPISATNELYKTLSQKSPDSAHYPHRSYSPMFPKTCIFAGLWLVAVFFFFFFFFLAVTLFPDSPSNFCMFLSVISKCLCWHKLLPTSGGKKKVQKPLHTSVCQIFANTSSPAGLAAEAVPVMAAAAAAAAPDAVAGAVWQDLNTQCSTHLCQCLGV